MNQFRKLRHLTQTQISLKETRMDVKNDEASNTLEESEDKENVANANDKGTQEDIIADQDLQGNLSV